MDRCIPFLIYPFPNPHGKKCEVYLPWFGSQMFPVGFIFLSILNMSFQGQDVLLAGLLESAGMWHIEHRLSDICSHTSL